MIKLSKRLQAIYDLANGNVIADIGCDHGYIPLKLDQKKHKKVYACDVAQGPLSRAQALFEKENAKIDTILMDGISALPEDVDQVIIAGMGGKLIESILEKGKDKLVNVDSLILSPHRNAESLRSYLIKNHFRIEKERLVFEEDHAYWIMYCRNGSQTRSDWQVWYGAHVKEDDDYRKYLKIEKYKWEDLQNKVPASRFEEGKARLKWLDSKISQS